MRTLYEIAYGLRACYYKNVVLKGDRGQYKAEAQAHFALKSIKAVCGRPGLEKMSTRTRPEML